MRKRIIIVCIIVLALTLGITGFNIIRNYNENRLVNQHLMSENDGRNYTYQKIAWESLNESLKKQVIGSWQKSTVETITEDNDFGIISLNNSGGQINIKGKEMIVVSFNAKNEEMLGKVIVYIDPLTMKAIGMAPRM